MAYTTTDLANSAVGMLSQVLNGLKVNNLDKYVTGQMRNDYITDEDYIRNALNRATNAAYDVNRTEALQNAADAEDTSYANTKNAIAEMRRNLIGAGSSGANVGAANATALQALLGLGQTNAQTTTEGLRNVNNVARERASALAQNAVDAISQANDATSKMYDAANSAYSADRSYAAQGAAEALGQLASAADSAASNERQTTETNQTNERMNTATNKANTDIAKIQTYTTTTQTKKGNKTTTKTTKNKKKNKKK